MSSDGNKSDFPTWHFGTVDISWIMDEHSVEHRLITLPFEKGIVLSWWCWERMRSLQRTFYQHVHHDVETNNIAEEALKIARDAVRHVLQNEARVDTRKLQQTLRKSFASLDAVQHPLSHPVKNVLILLYFFLKGYSRSDNAQLGYTAFLFMTVVRTCVDVVFGYGADQFPWKTQRVLFDNSPSLILEKQRIAYFLSVVSSAKSMSSRDMDCVLSFAHDHSHVDDIFTLVSNKILGP